MKKNLISNVQPEGWSVMLEGCFVNGGSGSHVKIDGIMNFAKQNKLKNLAASVRRYRVGHKVFNKMLRRISTLMVKETQTQRVRKDYKMSLYV